ncbi:MAG: glutamate--tRNA ligase, partial [Pseudomonadota bacterium]|nr:glutamate--tRNA ligase [Pseudomonadota bacterium]
ALNPAYLKPMISLAQTRVETFSDLPKLLGFFMAGKVDPAPELFAHKKLDADGVRKALQLLLWKLEALRDWDKDNITAVIQAVAAYMELKLRDLMPLLFPAITGQASSVSVLDAMAHLGPDLTRYRLRQTVELLGGTSKKENKAWQKELEAI